MLYLISNQKWLQNHYLKGFMKKLIYLFLFIFFHQSVESRSIHRPKNSSTPSISIRPSDQSIADSWLAIKTKKHLKSKKNHTLKNQFLRIKPLIQGFDSQIFQQYHIPSNEQILFKNKKGSVDSSILQELAEEVLEEIKVGQKEFNHFTVLKCKDFNFKSLSGLIVLKYKDYPFVLKLSIEHPHTMVQPYTKSFEATALFMIGGTLRHLSNFTRITNLHDLQRILKFNPYYTDKIDFPRKWYWRPEHNYDLLVTWNQTPHRAEEKITIPSAYAVISDLVDIDESYPQKELTNMAMKVAIDTRFLIDPHSGNTVMDKSTHKFTMLDTENFKMMTGLEHTMSAKTYAGWYAELVSSSLKKYCGRTKKERIQNSFQL